MQIGFRKNCKNCKCKGFLVYTACKYFLNFSLVGSEKSSTFVGDKFK